ncbi:MAG TPA: pseudouridine synthase [Vicinamibacterales bacterium]|jgi:pseudouridine synthase
MPPIRLQKLLSAAGVSSRRAAEGLITQGRVSVNGTTVTTLGTKADPDADDIRVDGRRIKPPRAARYILLNKPRGYITTRSDPEHRPTVIDLVAEGGVRDYIYPVGRLDYDSEGLLLLTSDGELAARLTHPRHGVAREYEVRVRGVPEPRLMRRLERGVVIDGRKTAPAEVRVRRTIDAPSGPQAFLSIVIHEGRNRQIRKMCDAIGHPVVSLRRVRIGPIADDRLKPGQFRELTAREVASLKRGSGIRDQGSGKPDSGSPIPDPRSRHSFSQDQPPESHEPHDVADVRAPIDFGVRDERGREKMRRRPARRKVAREHDRFRRRNHVVAGAVQKKNGRGRRRGR